MWIICYDNKVVEEFDTFYKANKEYKKLIEKAEKQSLYNKHKAEKTIENEKVILAKIDKKFFRTNNREIVEFQEETY